jgi:hypothetical protein
MAECKSCGAEVLWVLTAAGKKMPLSVASQERRFVFDADATVSDKEPRFKLVETYISHFADCPFADQHRRR